MVKSAYASTSIVPEWAKLPQYKGMYSQSEEIQDVDMEDIDISFQEKLVLPGNPRLKRSRTDSMFEVSFDTPVKRSRRFEMNRGASEMTPYVYPLLQQPEVNDDSAFHDKTNTTPTGREKTTEVSDKVENDLEVTQTACDPPTPSLSDVVPDEETPSPPFALAEEDSSLAKHYMQWLKNRKIARQDRPRSALPGEGSKPDYQDEMTLDTEFLANCYGLGERLGDVAYRNAILSIFQKYVVKEKVFPSDIAVSTIYKNTTKDSPARKMMVAFWAYAGGLSWLDSEQIRTAVCREFLEDLVVALLQARARPEKDEWPWVKDPYVYRIKSTDAKGTQ